MNEKIRFAVIGYGRIGKKHAATIRSLAGAQLTALCDSVAVERDRTDAGIPFYGSVQDMLDEEKNIDVISIATPNALHTEHALAALGAGKHVIIEKPMALTKADCGKLIDKAAEMEKNVFCIMQNRYSPASIWIKDMVSSGRLGKIFMVKADCFWNRDKRYYKAGDWKGTLALDGGPLFTQFSHFVDVMYWLFGKIHDIHASFFNFNHTQTTEFEDSGTISFRFTREGTGVINYSTAVWDKNFESSLTVIAENGVIKISGQYMNEITYCHVKDYTLDTAVGGHASDRLLTKYSPDNHTLMFQNVIEVLNGRAAITTTALEGMVVVEMIEDIYKLKEGRVFHK